MTMAKKRTGKGAEASALTPNPEKLISAKKIPELESKTEAAGSLETNQDSFPSAVTQREKIAVLAYTHWMQRGCPGGSPEEDWFRAEQEINAALSGPLAVN
jgi:hypothetical protein